MNEAEIQIGAEGRSRPTTPAKKIGPLDLNRWTADSALPRCPAAVLLALVRTVDNDTWCWPKGGEKAPGGICMEKLAARAKYAKRSAQRGTRLLEDLGLVKCTQRAWQVNAFEIYPEKIKAFYDDKKGARAALRALESDDDEDTEEEELPEVEGSVAPALEPEPQSGQSPRHAYVPLPSWAVYGTRARGVKGPEAVAITRAVVEAIQGPVSLDAMGTYARPILHLYERLNRPDLASWVKEVELVAEAAKHCGDRLWFKVRGYADDGQQPHEDRRESPRELCRVSKWEERLAAAHRHAEGRCTCGAYSQVPELSDVQEACIADEPKVVVPPGQEAGYCVTRGHDLNAAWAQAVENVANAHGSLAASCWLKSVDISHVEDGVAVLVVPNRTLREEVAKRFLPEIQAAFHGAIGFSLAEATGPPGSRSRP